MFLCCNERPYTVYETHMNRKTQLNTHLLTALVRACWWGEDPYSRPCKAVRKLGGVTHAEKHKHTPDRIRARLCIGRATEVCSQNRQHGYHLFSDQCAVITGQTLCKQSDSVGRNVMHYRGGE